MLNVYHFVGLYRVLQALCVLEVDLINFKRVLQLWAVGFGTVLSSDASCLPLNSSVDLGEGLGRHTLFPV